MVKRVIALPGQTIYSSGLSIYVDGRRLAEPYLPMVDALGRPIASGHHPYRVPSGDFYVLGDNRSDSCDSRFWGPVADAGGSGGGPWRARAEGAAGRGIGGRLTG